MTASVAISLGRGLGGRIEETPAFEWNIGVSGGLEDTDAHRNHPIKLGHSDCHKRRRWLQQGLTGVSRTIVFQGIEGFHLLQYSLIHRVLLLKPALDLPPKRLVPRCFPLKLTSRDRVQTKPSPAPSGPNLPLVAGR